MRRWMSENGKRYALQRTGIFRIRFDSRFIVRMFRTRGLVDRRSKTNQSSEL